jgi:hypothetical protein
MNQALYAHMNNKRKMKKKNPILFLTATGTERSICDYRTTPFHIKLHNGFGFVY